MFIDKISLSDSSTLTDISILLKALTLQFEYNLIIGISWKLMKCFLRFLYLDSILIDNQNDTTVFYQYHVTFTLIQLLIQEKLHHLVFFLAAKINISFSMNKLILEWDSQQQLYVKCVRFLWSLITQKQKQISSWFFSTNWNKWRTNWWLKHF